MRKLNNSYFINASTPRTDTGPLKGLTCGYHTAVIFAIDYAQVFPSREEWYKICQCMNHQSPMNRSELMKGKLNYRRTNLRRSEGSEEVKELSEQEGGVWCMIPSRGGVTRTLCPDNASFHLGRVVMWLSWCLPSRQETLASIPNTT